MKFLPLETALYKPITESDSSNYCFCAEEPVVVLKHPNYEKNNIGKANHLHFARLALWEFQNKHNKLPELHNDGDAEELYTIANGLKEQQQALEDGLKVVDAIPDETVDAKVRYVSNQLCKEDIKRYSLYARAGKNRKTKNERKLIHFENNIILIS